MYLLKGMLRGIHNEVIPQIVYGEYTIYAHTLLAIHAEQLKVVEVKMEKGAHENSEGIQFNALWQNFDCEF